ncbi:MAG: nucleotidyltransferase domain-containing protein [archaeon]
MRDILQKAILVSKADKKDIDQISLDLKIFLEKIKDIKAEIFVGGSFAKNTLIKKKRYDVDLFVMYKNGKNISNLLKSYLVRKKIPFTELHGSRNYFQVKVSPILTIELVPIVKIRKAAEAENITDISPLHVSYIANKIKANKNLSSEICLAKSFCFSQECYGAESYISGFSGYSLEVLVSYYGSFANFLRAMVKYKHEKIVIDPMKYYKGRAEVIGALNISKINSPIIVVDPVQKERNIVAALSHRTFLDFVRKAKRFLAKPSLNYFVKKEKKWGKGIILDVSIKSDKIDIVGAKFKKLYGFLIFKMERNGFVFSKTDWKFDEHTGKCSIFLGIKKIEPYLFIKGPPVKVKEEYLKKFKKKHKKISIKTGFYYATEKNKFKDVNSFLKVFLERERKTLETMHVKKIFLS